MSIKVLNTGDLGALRRITKGPQKLFVSHGEGFNTGAQWSKKKEVELIVTEDGKITYKGFSGYAYGHYEGKGVWSRYQGSEHLLKVFFESPKGKAKGKAASPKAKRKAATALIEAVVPAKKANEQKKKRKVVAVQIEFGDGARGDFFFEGVEKKDEKLFRQLTAAFVEKSGGKFVKIREDEAAAKNWEAPRKKVKVKIDYVELSKELVGRRFNLPTTKAKKDRWFKIKSIEPKNRKYPVICERESDGKEVKMEIETVKGSL